MNPGIKIPFQKETQHPKSQRVSPKGDGKGLNILTLNFALCLFGAEWWDWSLLTPTTSQKSSQIPSKWSFPGVLGAAWICLDSWHRRRILCLSWLSHFKTKPFVTEPTKKWRWRLEIQWLKKDGTCENEVILQSWNKCWRRGSALPQASLTLFVEQKFQQWPPAAVHGLFYPQLNCKLIFFLFYKRAACLTQPCSDYKEGSGIHFLPNQYKFHFAYLNS